MTGERGAGGVVWNAQGEVLLILNADHRWVFPKGHPEGGETPEQTAQREVLEETGVHGQVVGNLGETRYTNRFGVPRVVRWFLMRGSGPARPQSEQEALEAVFFPVPEALQRLGFPEDRDLLLRAQRQRESLERRGDDLPAVAAVLGRVRRVLEDVEQTLDWRGAGDDEGLARELSDELTQLGERLSELDRRLTAELERRG
ncbi:NUDIX hydrolase [Deinococcus aluminii]|uniref:RNA pyrophosphohydrolase n=1 Tax=Deinococcus aluminii TaxID=1656885 RepID=A0ABP9XHG0_9DEIO